MTRGKGIAGIVLGVALATLLLGSPIAEAQVTRCVGAQVSPCTTLNTYSNWYLAYGAAVKGDTLILANKDLKTLLPPPAPPEFQVPGDPENLTARLKVGKRLIVKTHTGVVLTDANMLPSPDYIVHVIDGGQGTDLRVKVEVTADGDVPRSAGGIFLEVDSDVLNGSSVEGPGKVPGNRRGVKPISDNGIRLPPPLEHLAATIGIRVNRGTGSKTMRVLGLSSDRTRVDGFGVGIFVDNPSFHVTSYIMAERNGIGLLQRWGRGQNFYGVWNNNDVAIEMQGVNHNDTNSHTFTCNGVALRSSMADQANPATGYRVNGPHLEYNFHTVTTCGGVDIEVEVSPGVFLTDRDLPPPHKGARTVDPGFYIQYSTRKVDKDLLPTWITGGPPAN